MTRALLLCAIVAVGCGGTVPAFTSPTPVASSVSVIGGWTGALTTAGTVVQTGERATVVCNQVWTITSQTGSQFSGSWQSSGGSCAQGGQLSGAVSSSGVISTLSLGVSVRTTPPAGATCVMSSGNEVFSGVASATSITASASNRLHCTVLGATVDLDRAMSLTMTKR